MKWIGTQTIYDGVRFRGAAGVNFGEIPITFEGQILAHNDILIYDATNDGNPVVNLGSSATEKLEIKSVYESGAQGLDYVVFKTYTAGSGTDAGKINFSVDETHIAGFRDAGLRIAPSKSLRIGDIDILTDSSGTTTLNNIDALDATTISTLNSALTAGDITGVTAGTGLSGGGTSGAVTLTADFSEFSAVTPADGDSLATLDSDGANEQLTTVASLATLFAGTGLSADGSVIEVDAAQTQITSVGTIGTGAWEGTDIATDQQKHLMHYQTTGYAAGDDTNYEMSRPMSVNTAPFQLNQPIGSDGLTAQTIQVWARAGGHVMPRACTLTRWSGWATSDGSATTYLALFKVELEDDVDSDPSAELLTEMTYTASGNATANFVETTSASTGGTLSIEAGDIVFFAMKGPGSTMYFNGTFEVEF